MRLELVSVRRGAARLWHDGAARLCHLNYDRRARRFGVVDARNQEWCTEQDSNLRSPKAPDLQSGLVAA